MIGLFISFLYGVYLLFFSGSQTTEIYLIVTNFLYNWYFWTSIVLTIVLVLMLLIGMIVGVGFGKALAGFEGAILVFLAGSATSALMLIFLAISRLSLISGAFLLNQSYQPTDGGTWDYIKMVFGIILIIIGVFTGMRGSSSKKN